MTEQEKPWTMEDQIRQWIDARKAEGWAFEGKYGPILPQPPR